MSIFSPDGSLELEEFLRGLDDPGVVTGQYAGAQEEAHIPVALQLVQAALFAQQAAQFNPCKNKIESCISILAKRENIVFGFVLG